MAAPVVDKKAIFGKKAAKKKWQKKLWYYGLGFAALAVCMIFLYYAERGRSAEREWAINYERRCEACQTMIVSGIMTRSMIYQQEKKRIDEERKQNPEFKVEDPKPVKAGIVLRYMCDEQQIDQMLSSQHFTFGDGYVTNEDPTFSPSLKKLCWLALQNGTMSQILKKMLDAPVQPMRKPTLVSASQVHFEPVCSRLSSMCSGDQLEHGMVDPAADQPDAIPQGTPQQGLPGQGMPQQGGVPGLQEQPGAAGQQEPITEL